MGIEKELSSKKSRVKRSRSTGDDQARPSELVRSSVDGLVRDGFATWRRRETGDTELLVVTGEIFLFGETTITRIA